MTKLFDHAIATISPMPPKVQDYIAQGMLCMAGADDLQENIPAEHRTGVMQGLAEAQSSPLRPWYGFSGLLQTA
ncbi:MAG: hypothetical protein EB121_06080 [Alphaproteobacteria bacterium]|nr:hypothetical protein [Alphaproteobacteria bacterium]NDG04898.1 hypothetical protein [Alphaproteobacteria bacterium]